MVRLSHRSCIALEKTRTSLAWDLYAYPSRNAFQELQFEMHPKRNAIMASKPKTERTA